MTDDQGREEQLAYSETMAKMLDEQARRHVAVQLAVYRLAWAGLSGCEVSQVRAVFHYVRSGRTVAPERLPDADELSALLNPEPARCAGS